MLRIIIVAIALGFALAMDAFAVSIANGMKEPSMRKKKGIMIASSFGVFQGLMPLIGYFLGALLLSKIEGVIPYVALGLLVFLGIKMIVDGFMDEDKEEHHEHLGVKLILIQSIATSIDALSVGFTISDYTLIEALITCLIVILITTFVCLLGVLMGEKFGSKLGDKAVIIGGIILILIGLEIFITGVFF